MVFSNFRRLPVGIASGSKREKMVIINYASLQKLVTMMGQPLPRAGHVEVIPRQGVRHGKDFATKVRSR